MAYGLMLDCADQFRGSAITNAGERDHAHETLRQLCDRGLMAGDDFAAIMRARHADMIKPDESDDEEDQPCGATD